tara:strand:+ start:5108 stop:5404 length:297 start_codon:yes stop_codon:yes gene_type:complete
MNQKTWDNLQNNKNKSKPINSIDGFARSHEQEKLINQLISSVFEGDNGKAVLKYLKSITLEAVAGPHMTSNELFHLEGRRFLVAILQQRINAHQKEKK